VGDARTKLIGFGRDSAAMTLLNARQRICLIGIGVAAAGWVVAGLPAVGVVLPALLVGSALTLVGVQVFRVGLFVAGWRQRGRTRPAVHTADVALPRYSVLVALRGEADGVASLVDWLSALVYPKDSLEILLLCETDDEETVAAVKALDMPPEFRLVVCPPGTPMTKPRACNIGLYEATGDLCVVYDAEDRPELDQLRKAAEQFAASPPEVICLQARLDHHNPDVNWLSRWFTVEYAALFGFILPGLMRFGLPVPLGGTSNHFRVDALRALGGWDPYNVTEDADLGLRLRAAGTHTRMLDSTTLEEACARARPWIRQRTRWMKGYLQTWLVHMRDPASRRFPAALHLFVGGTPVCSVILLGVVLVLPLTWFDGLLPQPSWLPLVLSASLATACVCVIAGAVCCVAVERRWTLLPAALTLPVYLLLVAVATLRALLQMPHRLHLWEKTPHGLTGADTDPGLSGTPQRRPDDTGDLDQRDPA
jgi:cellulose synthase/poly-beta-1,6-N-acetylglucosamine synthase-like glycosyltransferase